MKKSKVAKKTTKKVAKKASTKKSSSTKNEYISDTKAFSNYDKAWKLSTKNFLPLIAVVIIIAAIDILRGIIEERFSAISLIILFLVVLPIGMSTSWTFLKAVRKEKFVVSDMFSVFKRNYWNAVLAGILMSIFIIIGLICFIIPGVILIIRFSFVSYLVIDKKMEAMAAIKESWKMTKGHSWTILGMILLAIPIIMGGLIVLLVGVLFSFVWISAAFAILYHSVSLKKK